MARERQSSGRLQRRDPVKIACGHEPRGSVCMGGSQVTGQGHCSSQMEVAELTQIPRQVAVKALHIVADGAFDPAVGLLVKIGIELTRFGQRARRENHP